MTKPSRLEGVANDKLKRFATLASVTVAVTLIGAKLVAWLLTGSVALLTSLVDSTIDLLSSLVTMFGVSSAMKPPDLDHRYGHGKAEPLAALAQAAFIIGSSVLLGYEAIGRFYKSQPVNNLDAGYIVMGVAIVMTLALVSFQSYVVRRTQSMAIVADRMHYVGDVAINIAVVAAFILQQWTGLTWVDPVFALGIALVMSGNAVNIGRDALNVLMDRELPESQRDRITMIARSCSGVLGTHDLRTRSDSGCAFIDLHLELPQDMTIAAAHRVTEEVVTRIREHFPDASVMVRQDPVGIVEPRLDEQIARKRE